MSRAAHIAALAELLARYARGEDVRAELTKLAAAMGDAPQLALPGAPAPPAAPAGDSRDAAHRVFVYWQQKTGHKGARLTPERAQKILARLRQGYDERVLKAAIDGLVSSPFHRGENEQGTVYDDIGLVFRNGENVEKFARMVSPELAPPDTSPAGQAEARRNKLMQEAEALLRAGDTDGYNRIVRSLSAGKAS